MMVMNRHIAASDNRVPASLRVLAALAAPLIRPITLGRHRHRPFVRAARITPCSEARCALIRSCRPVRAIRSATVRGSTPA
jgi:hypothetical protein